jgi:hypothetical protein
VVAWKGVSVNWTTVRIRLLQSMFLLAIAVIYIFVLMRGAFL